MSKQRKKPAKTFIVTRTAKATARRTTKKTTSEAIPVNCKHALRASTAKLFMTGRSQAVRLPKEYRFDGKEVYIERVGDKIILSPKPNTWEHFFKHVPAVSDDFMETREDPQAEDRELFD